MNEKIFFENGVYRCPKCGSKKVVEVLECVVFRYFNLNTKKMVNPATGNAYMSNRDKAFQYDNSEGISGGYYECLNCQWINIED